jgi:hypothetical protein
LATTIVGNPIIALNDGICQIIDSPAPIAPDGIPLDDGIICIGSHLYSIIGIGINSAICDPHSISCMQEIDPMSGAVDYIEPVKSVQLR